VVGEAENSTQAVALALQTAPDVVLMDLVMPDMDRVKATAGQIGFTARPSGDFPSITAVGTSFSYPCWSVVIYPPRRRSGRTGGRHPQSGSWQAMISSRVAARLVQEIQGCAKKFNPFAELSERELEVLRLIAMEK
jgi:hypothetical protein